MALFRRRSTAATIDLGSRAVARNPFPHYEELRRAGSVQYLPKNDGWVVLNYADVQAAFAEPEVFSNRPYAPVDAVLLAADPPDHAASRKIVSRHFASDVIDRLVAFASEHSRSLLKPRMNVVSEYANPLSAAVAAQLIGFDSGDFHRIQMVRSDPAGVSDYDGLIRLLDAITERASLYGQLRSDGLDERQCRSLVRLLWLAATTTTQRVIAHAVLRLLQHEEARDIAVVDAFVDEVLRLHPPELLVSRFAVRNVSLGGVTIPEHATVYLCIAAANRDPAIFERAAELRLDRTPSRTLTFGSGIHYCVGAMLGRRIVQTAVRTLLTDAPHFRATHALDSLVEGCSMTANPVSRLLIECPS